MKTRGEESAQRTSAEEQYAPEREREREREREPAMRLVGVFAPATDHDRLTQLNHDDVGHTGHRTDYSGHLVSTQDTGRTSYLNTGHRTDILSQHTGLRTKDILSQHRTQDSAQLRTWCFV